ncbi:MAG: RluA family pseudouridine synthase [Bacteroidota bacterium]
MQHFHPLELDDQQNELPQKFTFPFFYEPHDLAVQAANQLKDYLISQNEWKHPFGLDDNGKTSSGMGKMFGVLVVKNQANQLGFLAAFSGKLADSNHFRYFVPPVFDLLDLDGFYKQEEAVLNQINAKIQKLENQTSYRSLKETFNHQRKQSEDEINQQKNSIKNGKKERDAQRIQAKKKLSESDYNQFNKELSELSKSSSIHLKKMKKYWQYQLNLTKSRIGVYEAKISELKALRKEKSAALQQKIFQHYRFLNAKDEYKNISEIFDENPPAGAGECAAPKLLQYAFQNKLKPIAMAEFWWGKSPEGRVRKHGEFYPACRSKCEPILGHMLKGLAVEENPLLKNPAEGKDIEIVYEDDVLAVINKPAEFLSVPGKNISDSVYERVKKLYPQASGPLVVHRLDMSTSGLLLIAKTEKIHKKLQAQFIQHQVKKRYVALLAGKIDGNEGKIDLPLRVDLDNRPQQMVCYEYGKPALTKWKLIDKTETTTRVHFYPISGRTHQLRVHAAHKKGLNTPILGDDLYGKKANRLHLHAEKITFTHPRTKTEMSIVKNPDF